MAHRLQRGPRTGRTNWPPSLTSGQFSSSTELASYSSAIPMFDQDRKIQRVQKGYFLPPAKGENPFVFVVQTKDGQKTYTPEEFEKLTNGKWKNDPDSLT